MELILLLIYSFFVWLIFFKFKLLPWNIISQVIVVTLPVIGLTVTVLYLNIVCPSSHEVRAMNYVIPVVPRVTGTVTEVPIEPNRPIKKGDVLFKLDPVPFQYAVKAAEGKMAQLRAALVTAQANQRGLEDQLKNAAAKKAAIMVKVDLAKKRVTQYTNLTAAGAGRTMDLEAAQSDVANLESEIVAADATESQVKQKLAAKMETGEIDEIANVKAQMAQAEAALDQAKWDLENTTHLAPANGTVTNLALRPGVRATQLPLSPVMSFIESDDQWVLAFFDQNEVRDVQPGDEAEIFVKMLPGRIIKCKVDSILWATAQGQMPISGTLMDTSAAYGKQQRIAVRLLVEPKDKEVFLAAGAYGAGTIYTQHGKFLHMIRKCFVRVSTKVDWFIFKLH